MNEPTSRKELFWEKAGIDFDPTSCDPFYMRAESDDQLSGDFATKQYFWFSRIDNVKPQMWQIMIEAVVSPHDIGFTSREEVEMTFDLALAIRGKNADQMDWKTVYSGFHK